MRGTEKVFEETLDRSIEESTAKEYRYLEIGIATGNTIWEVAKHLSIKIPFFECNGIDLLTGDYFNSNEFIKHSIDGGGFDIKIDVCGSELKPKIGGFSKRMVFQDIKIILLKSANDVILYENNSFSFALIDGCHGKACVERDFTGMEKAIAPGGIVAFHDAMPEDQGVGYQPHCKEPINVLAAIDSLGLSWMKYGSEKCTRDGWKYIGNVSGDKTAGNAEQNGNGFVFVQKLI